LAEAPRVIDQLVDPILPGQLAHLIERLEGYTEGAEAVEDRPLYVEPHLRPELVEVGENAESIFERIPLRLEQAENNMTGTGVPEYPEVPGAMLAIFPLRA